MQSGHCLAQKLQLSHTIDRQTRQDSNVGRRQRMQRGGMYSMSGVTDPKIARMERPAFATSREVPGAPTRDDHGSLHGRRPCCQIRTSPKNSSVSTPSSPVSSRSTARPTWTGKMSNGPRSEGIHCSARRSKRAAEAWYRCHATAGPSPSWTSKQRRFHTPTHGNWKPPRRSVHLVQGMLVHTNRRTGGSPAMERGCPGDPKCTSSTTEAQRRNASRSRPSATSSWRWALNSIHAAAWITWYLVWAARLVPNSLMGKQGPFLHKKKETVSPRVPPSKRENKRYFGQGTWAKTFVGSNLWQ